MLSWRRPQYGARVVDDERHRALELAEELAVDCVERLGALMVSVILHGSLVLGGYAPGHSDVDLLVVVERSLDDGELGALERLVVARAPAGIDFRVVTRAVAAAPARSRVRPQPRRSRARARSSGLSPTRGSSPTGTRSSRAGRV